MTSEYRAYRVLDLFAGAGGMSLGFERMGFEVVAAVEKDRQAAATYQANHFAPIVVRDIADFDEWHARELGEIDVVIGGPPCQSFSTVGRQREDDPRGRLFEQYCRVLRLVRPKAFVFENVRGLLVMDGGRRFDEVAEALTACGYRVFAKLLNAVDYDVPQTRARLIIVGTRTDLGLDEVFGFDGGSGEPPMTLLDAIGDLPPAAKTETDATIDGHFWPAHSDETVELISNIPTDGKLSEAIPGARRAFPNSYARLSWGKPAGAITTSFAAAGSTRCIHPVENRALTIREAARIQTFPDTYRFEGSIQSRRRQIGNAVPPRFAHWLAYMLRLHLSPLEAQEAA